MNFDILVMLSPQNEYHSTVSFLEEHSSITFS